MLTDKYLAGVVPEGSRAESSPFLSRDEISDVYRTRAAALNEIAIARGQSLAQLALRHDAVTSALIGASSTAQLEHNVAAVRFPDFTTEELARIDEHGVDGTVLRPSGAH